MTQTLSRRSLFVGTSMAIGAVLLAAPRHKPSYVANTGPTWRPSSADPTPKTVPLTPAKP